MRKKIIIGNWKMNKTISQAKSFVKELNQLISDNEEQISSNLDYGVASSFIALNEIGKIKNDKMILSSQNVFHEKSGAFTGEISIDMLKEINVTHAIVGHSERREIFKEDDQLINKKVLALMENGLIPVFCCGENLKQYEESQTEEVITNQIKEGLKNVSDWSKIIIAYEPIWAIGTGKTASPQDAQKVCSLIRKLTSEKVTIQYGGSVKPDNIESLLSQKDIDGALVGGASLEAESFFGLLKNGSKALKGNN